MDFNEENWDLTPIIYPKSLVVFGLSRRNYNHPGNTAFVKNVMEMQVKTYGVTPNAAEEQGFKLYKKVTDLPEVPDLAVIAVNATNALEAIKNAAEFGIRGCVVISAGFAEVGKKEREMQNTNGEDL